VGLNLAARLFGKIVASVLTESDVRAFTRENVADGRANSARSTGDERALSLQQKAH